MCGIAGAFGVVVPPERAARALARLSRRGPDHQGEWRSSEGVPVWLGHRRLSIVDLSAAGHQPMVDDDGGLHLVCNGEIYNAPALRRELERSGRRFRSGSDSEVILHGYARWGDEVLARLEGMYAFALWDHKKQRLFSARDPLGIKPLYFAELSGGVVLASEGNALRDLGVETEPEPMGLAHLLTLGYIPAPWSLWRGVNKLSAGHALTWTPGEGMRIVRHWSPPDALDESPPRAWEPLFEGVLREHLLADVPLGLLLSAGLDSGSLAVGLARLGERPTAYSVSLPDATWDESVLAGQLADSLGFPHRVIPLSAAEMAAGADAISRWPDEPLGCGGYHTLIPLCRAVAAERKVALAGDGGDEVLGGYKWYHGVERFRPAGGEEGLRRWFRSLILRGRLPSRVLGQAMEQFARRSLLHRHAWNLFPRFLPEEVEGLLAPLGLRFDDEAMLAPLRRHWVEALPPRRALQRVDLMTYCADYNLPKVDRSSMAHGLEVRVPFLDRRIVAWGLTRPLEPEEGRVSKPALRRYLAGRVPPAILAAPKQGFSARGLNERFDWGRAMEAVAEGPWVRRGAWSPAWRRMVAPGVPHREGRLWLLFVLTRWAEGHWP
ncbi:MAG: asparagine synthase (glutamine-hydrolyzing) [Magnetococcales bacterium]|nr:asparagine synthase (glutamine-hydrolyzing) [Magnetococcales bacterium]